MSSFQRQPVPNLALDRGVVYVASQQISRAADGSLQSTGDDPRLLFWLPVARNRITFDIRIDSEAAGSPIVVYYGHSARMQFSDRQKIVLDSQQPDSGALTCDFPQPVHWIRVDPLDAMGPFQIRKLGIELPRGSGAQAALESLPASVRHAPRDTIRQVRRCIQTGLWRPDDLMLLVTHEISGTGAPLLCRKISAAMRQAGRRCVILSLPMSGACRPQDQAAFAAECDALFLPSSLDQFQQLVRQLAGLGFRRALLNTVVSGKVISLIRQNGFKTVSLIHEMRSSCRILHAEESIRQIAETADAVVFPAGCVRDDFLSFGYPVRGRCVVQPQGFYKETAQAAQDGQGAALARRWGLPEATRFVCGAGSINFGKGVDILAQVARLLIAGEDGAVRYHFFWIGGTNAPEYDIWVRDQIVRMGLSDRFRFIGYLADEQAYMDQLSAASVYALVSREDSLPSVMLESMVAGVPVVAFRGSGGAEDILADGRGFLVDYLDIQAFAGTVDRICRGETSTDEITKKAGAYVRHDLSFRRYVKRLMEQFDEIG